MEQRKTSSVVERRFNKMINANVIVSLIMLFVGIILLLNPDFSNKFIGILVGVTFIFSGVNMIYDFVKRDGAKLYSFNIMFGIMAVLLGILLIVYPYSLMKFVTICLGIYFIVYGALKINYSVWFKIGGEDSWVLNLVMGILIIVFGILIMTNPFASLTVTQLIGIFLIIMAILEVTDSILFKKRANDIMKIFW